MNTPVASSVTHQHLLSTVLSEAMDRPELTIVDIGCGSGTLTRFLRNSIAILRPEYAVKVTGFDVSDFAPDDNSNLSSDTAVIRSGEPWPYEDHSVDIMVSNQVLEHVSDEKFFFSEISRCVKKDGISIHLFPLKNVIWEGHVYVPLAHRIPSPGFIRMMSLIFGSEKGKNIPGGHEREFGECAADYIRKYTAYRTMAELKRAATPYGLQVSFDYTPYFYTAKLRASLGRRPKFTYRSSPTFENLSCYALRYVSSITLVTRRIA